MNEQLLFFQALAKFLDKERIRVSFDRPPKLDRTFWEDADDAKKTRTAPRWKKSRNVCGKTHRILNALKKSHASWRAEALIPCPGMIFSKKTGEAFASPAS